MLSISIQIRTTDKMMKDVNAALDPQVFYGFFTCAAKLAGRHRRAISHAVVHLASDFQPLRAQFIKDASSLLDDWPSFLPKPQPLLTSVVAKHSSDGAGDLGTSQVAMQAAIFEQAIMDAADLRVISTGSGYAQMSVLRSWRNGGEGSTCMLPKVNEDTWYTMDHTYDRQLTCDDPAAPISLTDLDKYWCCHL